MLYRETEISSFIFMARHADIISMDHDLGEGVKTGYEILCCLEKEVMTQELWKDKGAPEIFVHSANPVGKENMRRAIDAIYNKVGRR